MPVLLQSSFVPDSLSISTQTDGGTLWRNSCLSTVSAADSIYFPQISNGILMDDRPALSNESISVVGIFCAKS